MEALKDGVAEAAANPPDIILLDLGLPDSNGVETMQRLQAELPEVPIIVLTGIEDEDLGIQAIRSHAQDYLTKSLASGHVLSRTIIYALERSSLRRHLVRADRLAAVGELAAGIAHEVNNPAAFVMANLEVMRDDVASVREAFETLVDLARRTDAAAVDRLLKESELTRKLADWTDIVDESLRGDGADSSLDPRPSYVLQDRGVRHRTGLGERRRQFGLQHAPARAPTAGAAG